MLTKEDIEAVARRHSRDRLHANDDGFVPVADLCRLAMLGLAVVESGVTAEDMDVDMHAVSDGDARVLAMFDALAAALREGAK